MLVAPPGGDAGAARLLRRGARPRRRPGAARAAGRRSTSPSATPSRCSTSAPRRAASTARRPGSARRPRASATMPLAELAAPAAALARDGVEVNAAAGATCSRSSRRSPRPRRSRARCYCPTAGVPRDGRRARATRSSPTRSSGSAPRARRRSTRATSPRRSSRLGAASAAARSRATDLAAYAAIPREPVRVALPRPRGAHQPAAERRRDPARLRARAARARRRAAGRGARSSTRWRRAQAERTPEFLDGLAEPGFLERVHGLAGSARPRTSRCSTPTAGRAR